MMPVLLKRKIVMHVSHGNDDAHSSNKIKHDLLLCLIMQIRVGAFLKLGNPTLVKSEGLNFRTYNILSFESQRKRADSVPRDMRYGLLPLSLLCNIDKRSGQKTKLSYKIIYYNRDRYGLVCQPPCNQY